MAITVTDITNGSVVDNEWTGEAIFDVLMNAVNKNIEIQYNNQRITGNDYAQVYLGAMQSVLQQSVSFAVNKSQADVYNAQVALYDRQREGFDDDAKQKLLKIAMDSWAVAYSTAPDGVAIPDAIVKRTIDKLMEDAMIGLGISETDDMSSFNAIDNVYAETGQTV